MSLHPHRARTPRGQGSSPRLFRRFRRDRRGVAAIEFALILPILVLLALGCFEVPRYVLLWQRLERTASGVSDLVAQADEPMTGSQMSDIMSAGKILMQPYDIIKNGSIVVTAIANPTGGVGVSNWWRKACGTVNTSGTLGSIPANPMTGASTPAGLPAALLPSKDNEVLVTEVYFNFTPVFKTFIYTGNTLYAVAYTRPRNHNLMTAPDKTDASKPFICPT